MTQIYCHGQPPCEGLANPDDISCRSVLSEEEFGTRLPKGLGLLPGDSFSGQSPIAQTQTGPQEGSGGGKISSWPPAALQGGLCRAVARGYQLQIEMTGFRS